MKSPLLDRIIAEIGVLEAAGNPPKVICIGREQLEAICTGLDIAFPIEGLTDFLGMEVKIVPDFALIDGAGQMHTQ